MKLSFSHSTTQRITTTTTKITNEHKIARQMSNDKFVQSLIWSQIYLMRNCCGKRIKDFDCFNKTNWMIFQLNTDNRMYVLVVNPKSIQKKMCAYVWRKQTESIKKYTTIELEKEKRNTHSHTQCLYITMFNLSQNIKLIGRTNENRSDIDV